MNLHPLFTNIPTDRESADDVHGMAGVATSDLTTPPPLVTLPNLLVVRPRSKLSLKPVTKLPTILPWPIFRRSIKSRLASTGM